MEEDLTPGRQREHPEQATSSVQARIESDQRETASELESTRAARALRDAEKRGEERGRVAEILEGLARSIAEHAAMLARYNGDLGTIKATLQRNEVRAEAERDATLEYRKERERREDRAQPWKLQAASAIMALLLVVVGALVSHYLLK